MAKKPEPLKKVTGLRLEIKTVRDRYVNLYDYDFSLAG